MDAAIHPGAHDIPRNGIDEDCTDGDSHDGDGDHYSDPAAPGQPRDCDDTRAAVNPAAFDVPRDGVDEDCRDGDADYPRIQADIRHAEKGAGTRTMIKRLTVTSPPADASVTLACRGRGCRVHRLSLTARRAGVSIKLARYFRHVRLAPAATIRVAVTTPDAYGKMLRLSIRRARPPKVTWFKVDPITRKVTPW